VHTPEEQPWDGGDLFEEIQRSNVADFRQMRPQCTVEIVVRDADIPVEFSFGYFGVEAPSGYVLEALAASLPQLFSDMEARISEARGATLPLIGFWDSVPGPWLVVTSLVPDSEKR